MATKSPAPPLAALVSMPDDDEEMRASRQKYINAQAKMLEALQARNEFFDPRHLAMARAFLQPTKSGRFGESLGNAMEAYGTAGEAERKRNIEMAQIQAELAAQEVAGRQEARKQRLSANLLSLDQPVNEEEFRRLAMIGGPEAAAKTRELRDKMLASKRQESLRTAIPSLLQIGESGESPTFESMMLYAKLNGLDPMMVMDFYEKSMPKPITVSPGAKVFQRGIGGENFREVASAPDRPTTISPGQSLITQGGNVVATMPEKAPEVMRDYQLLMDATTPPVVKLSLAIKLLGPGLDPKTILTPGGQVNTNIIDQINSRYPGLTQPGSQAASTSKPVMAQPTVSAAPSRAEASAPQVATPVPQSQVSPQAAPQAPRPAPQPAQQEAAQTFGPGKYAIPQPARLQPSPTGFTPGSKEDLEARGQQNTADARRFDEMFKSATDKGQAAQRTIPTLETALRAVQSADYRGGVFARPEQFVNQIKTAFGIADNVDVSRMLKTSVVDQALREQVLQNLRASFGGNPTEGERAFLMSVNSISDPRELLTYSLMGKMAAAQKDAARYDYLRTYGNYGIAADAAFDRWSGSKGPEFYYPPLTKAREQLLNSSAIAEQWKDRGGYQPDKYDYELRDGKWLRRPKQR